MKASGKLPIADKFSATPFLTMAKGPAAPLFYAMVYDIDGRQRLTPSEMEDPAATLSYNGRNLYQRLARVSSTTP